MTKKLIYATPAVLRRIPVEPEGAILAGSMVDSSSGVQTTGQQTGDFFDTSDPGSTFNHTWGE
jgi:hypothetical protein